MNTLDLIYLQNPWLRDRASIPKEKAWMKRAMYQSLQDELHTSRQILAITGLRRVGKSTMLKQLIAHLLESNTHPDHILYFSFDRPAIEENSGTLESVLQIYSEHILRQSFNKLSETVWIFLDEVQLIPYWQDLLKRYYDITKYIKFIVTGSAALFLVPSSKESLAGRMFSYAAGPFSFQEYSTLSKNHDIRQYLEIGQFPELLQFDDRTKQLDYLRDAVVSRVVEIDIPKLFGIRKIVDFERLFWSLLPNSGQIIKTASLGSDLGIKKSTLFKYLSILDQALLTTTTHNVSGSFRSVSRLLRKIYPSSSNFLSLSPDPISIGMYAEVYVRTQLQQLRTPVYLYRHRTNEVDFVLPEKKLAIEVKYRSSIHASDYRFLQAYAKEKKYTPILVTREDVKMIDGVECVPLADIDTWVRKVRSERKEYVMQDGDVVEFKIGS